MEYKFKVEEFEGPLDLLLHLIKKEDIDIFEIDISNITDQYLKYIEGLKKLNLNIDSEYIVVASELIELKSRELLPHNEDEEAEEDPKETFINRLIEYKKYKEISKDLKELEIERKKIYTKQASLMDEYQDESVKVDEDITLNDLLNAFKKFREKKEYEKPLNTVITKKEYSVKKRCTEIKNKLKHYKNIKFEELFEIYTKDYVVVTFLAILDLAKNGEVKLRQDRNLDTIILSAKGE